MAFFYLLVFTLPPPNFISTTVVSTNYLIPEKRKKEKWKLSEETGLVLLKDDSASIPEGILTSKDSPNEL